MLLFGGIFYGSVFVGQWAWITVGLVVLLFAYEGPVARLAGAEPRRWPYRWRAALATTLILAILLEAMGGLGTWASSGRFGSPVVVGPAVVALCYLLACAARGLAVTPTYRRFLTRKAEVTTHGRARLDRWTAELTERAAHAQPWTDSTAPTSPAVSSDRSASDVT